VASGSNNFVGGDAEEMDAAETERIQRRSFLKSAAAACSVFALRTDYGRPVKRSHSDAYSLVAFTDRERMLSAAEQYVSVHPVTITAYRAKGSAGGLHDFYSQADYF